MTHLCGVSTGLLVFSAMIFCGLSAGNPLDVILLRAIAGMFFGLILGMLLGCIGLRVVREHADADIEEAAAPVDGAAERAEQQVAEEAAQPQV